MKALPETLLLICLGCRQAMSPQFTSGRWTWRTHSRAELPRHPVMCGGEKHPTASPRTLPGESILRETHISILYRFSLASATQECDTCFHGVQTRWAFAGPARAPFLLRTVIGSSQDPLIKLCMTPSLKPEATRCKESLPCHLSQKP